MDNQLLQIQNRSCRIYGDTGAEYLLLQMADEKMYQDKRYKKQLQKNGPLAARRSMLAESISTDSLKEKIKRLKESS